MAKTYIYVRVSTKEQAAEGDSLATQAREGLAYGKSLGLEIGTESNYNNPGVFADPGVSAWRIPALERPGFLAMWKTMKPGDSFICLSIDRAFRSVHDFSGMCSVFSDAEINPIFIRDKFDMRTPTGKLMGHMCASFAQFKSDMISARVKEGHAVKRQRNIKGSTPDPRPILQAANAGLASLVQDGSIVVDDGMPKVRGRVFGYSRVSSGNQRTDSQVPLIEFSMNRMAAEGYTPVPEILEDLGVSAYSVDWKDRPMGKVLWGQLQPYDCVVVSRLDRIFRSVHDMANTTKSLIEQDIHLVTGCGLDTRTPLGRQGIEILSMMAAWESREISWRSQMVHKHCKALRGKWISEYNSPKWMDVVYKDSGWTLHPNLTWIAQYREVQELLVEQRMGLQEAADYMEERIAARLGRPILPATRFNPMSWQRHHNKKLPPEQVKALRKWLRGRKRDKDGCVDREWSYIRVKNARRHFEDIENVMSVC
jgi:DNA invertase Pin-like site-specific DNA recombinase